VADRNIPFPVVATLVTVAGVATASQLVEGRLPLGSRAQQRLRRRFAEVKAQGAAPELLEAVDESLETMSAVVPQTRTRLRDVGFRVKKAGRGGWFRPGPPGWIDLAPGRQSAPFVTHQAFHALDVGPKGYPWVSAIEGPSRSLAEEARDMARDRLLAYSARVVEQRLASLPPRLRKRLLAGASVELREALSDLLSELGIDADPGGLEQALLSARSPFGGTHPGLLARSAPPELVPPLSVIGALLPSGIPIRLIGRPQSEVREYQRTLTAKRLHDAVVSYETRVYEVFARLMDQALRVEAARRSLPLPLAQDRPDDLLPAEFARLEPRVWRLMRDRGWTW
jgi:hypothetical protein